MSKHRLIPNRPDRLMIGLRHATGSVLILLCACAALTSARAGLSRLMSEYGAAVGSTEAAQRAIDFNRADPEAHYAYANQLLSAGQTGAAVAEFQLAISMRPEDYFLWQELGRAQEDNGDAEGAIISLRWAAKFASYYSQPHWQLGNVLLREGQMVEAFEEMHRGATNDPTLFPALCDLAWGVYRGNVAAIVAATKPQTDDERVLLARLFLNHDQMAAGLNLLDGLTDIGAEDRRSFVNTLINQREYEAAYKIWSGGATSGTREVLFDGGFEGSMHFDDQGFGWRFMPAQTIRPFIDPNDPYSGQRSLRLDYSGNFNPAVPIVTELVIVSPSAHYRLSFAARTEDLSSAGLPLVLIKDASDDHQVLSQSASLPAGTSLWKEFAVDFETTEKTVAITINIQRQPCASNPCPIVGHAWFDSFSLTKRLVA
jgi:tetratricopeptide (TPR) repeat protein